MRKFFASLFALLLPSYALAGDVTEWLSVDTYLRARALSSLNGGQSGTLGNSTLLGRLMNESTKLQVDAEAHPMQDVLAHIRLEGETFKGADTNFGSLAKLVLTQTYVQIDNCLTDACQALKMRSSRPKNDSGTATPRTPASAFTIWTKPARRSPSKSASCYRRNITPSAQAIAPTCTASWKSAAATAMASQNGHTHRTKRRIRQ